MLYAFNRNLATVYSLGFSNTTLRCSPVLPDFLQVSGTHFEYKAVSAVITFKQQTFFCILYKDAIQELSIVPSI